MTYSDGPDSEHDGASLLRAALERRIAGVPGCVVSLRDGRPAYDERIRKGRATDPSASEEAVRALFVIHLVHDLGYKPESVSPSMTASADALRNVILDARRTDVRLLDILQEAPQESA